MLYEYLLTPHVAHAISSVQVALGLCDLLSKIYRKLAECTAVSGAPASLAEAVARVDEKLEENFLAPATKHAEGLAKGALRSTLGGLDPIFQRLWGQSTPLPPDVDANERSSLTAGLSGQL